MSTKSSLASGPGFNLFAELGEEDRVYLEIEGADFTACNHGVTVSIPLAVWEVVRDHTSAEYDLADLSDEELRARVEIQVDERLRWHAEALGRGEATRRLSGLLVYGPVTESREAQIESGMQWFGLKRYRQRALREEVAALRARDLG